MVLSGTKVSREAGITGQFPRNANLLLKRRSSFSSRCASLSSFGLLDRSRTFYGFHHVLIDQFSLCAPLADRRTIALTGRNWSRRASPLGSVSFSVCITKTT